MQDASTIRPGELVADVILSEDAAISFIGTIHTPFASRSDCPRQGSFDGPVCSIVLKRQWVPALEGLGDHERIEVFYWLDRASRNFLLQKPRDGKGTGTFALRSPNRPNPIGVSLVTLERIEDNCLTVRGLDCVDGTPLVDIKPERRDAKAPQT